MSRRGFIKGISSSCRGWTRRLETDWWWGVNGIISKRIFRWDFLLTSKILELKRQLHFQDGEPSLLKMSWLQTKTAEMSRVLEEFQLLPLKPFISGNWTSNVVIWKEKNWSSYNPCGPQLCLCMMLSLYCRTPCFDFNQRLLFETGVHGSKLLCTQ